MFMIRRAYIDLFDIFEGIAFMIMKGFIKYNIDIARYGLLLRIFVFADINFS